MDLNNRVTIITGGSSGIGAATAEAFTKEGANVVIVGRNEEKLQTVAKKCLGIGKLPLAIKADITNDNEAKHVIQETLKKFGKIDVLVNNAGIMRYSTMLDSNYVEIYDAIMNINLRAMFVLSNLAAPHLVKSKGNIINISSIMKTAHFPGFSAYSASKAAIVKFTRVIANELAVKGVRVNSVSPGPVETNLFELTGGEKVWDIDHLKSFTALDKVSKAEEIAEIILYLATDKASSVTGSDFLIDCGVSVKH